MSGSRGSSGKRGSGGQIYRPSSPTHRSPAYSQQQQPSGRHPGLMGQMAAAGAGVAAGSVVGEGISRSIFGWREGAPQSHQQPIVCERELEQFLNCALNQQELSFL